MLVSGYFAALIAAVSALPGRVFNNDNDLTKEQQNKVATAPDSHRSHFDSLPKTSTSYTEKEYDEDDEEDFRPDLGDDMRDISGEKQGATEIDAKRFKEEPDPDFVDPKTRRSKKLTEAEEDEFSEPQKLIEAVEESCTQFAQAGPNESSQVDQSILTFCENLPTMKRKMVYVENECNGANNDKECKRATKMLKAEMHEKMQTLSDALDLDPVAAH